MEKTLYEENLGVIEVHGKDAKDFLHRLTSQDFKNFNEGDVKNAALLTANSQIQFLFTATLNLGIFSLSIEQAYVSALHVALEKLHFAEDLSFKTSEPSEQPSRLTEPERIEKGLWKFGMDITEKNLILEAPANSYVHRDKGCYPGQEVVERVFTYGQVAKKLMKIQLNEPLKAGENLSAGGKVIGKITSAHGVHAFGFVHKTHYKNLTKIDQGQIFDVGDHF